MTYRQIVVSLAGQPDEESVIHEAVRLAAAVDAELKVLHVNDPAAGKVTMMMDAEPLVQETDLRKQFADLGYGELSDRMRVEIRTSSNLGREIAAATEGADMLVIGHRQKHRFLAMLTDVADKHLADLVQCPILIVPRKAL
ncbi:MAG: universal stress protein [Rhodothermia bacterium]|nr:universal stress protein [Rhodothermia bacterium]